MSLKKANLKIDWCSHDAAKFAVMNWHYSKAMPVGKLIKIGAWEDGKFIGCVLFGRGANNNMLKPFNLAQTEGCELVRIALDRHSIPVSRIVRVALIFLKMNSPKLMLCISYADPEQGHHGGIYQAGNWIYTGLSSKAVKVFYNGKWSHKKTVDDSGVDQSLLEKKTVPGKHRYLMPLTRQMKDSIIRLSRPYPKKKQAAEA